jgi:hypothetical protein
LIQIRAEFVPLANLLAAVRQNFEGNLTEELMNELKFLCKRIRYARQVVARRARRTGAERPQVGSLTQQQSNDLHSIAESLNTLTRILEIQVRTSFRLRFSSDANLGTDRSGCCPAYVYSGCCPDYVYSGCCSAYVYSGRCAGKVRSVGRSQSRSSKLYCSCESLRSRIHGLS